MKPTLAFLLFFPLVSFAADNPGVATLAQTQGKTQLFTKPSKKPYPEKSLKEGTMALFEGDYYLIQEAKVGDRVENGNILRTLPGAQTKVIYDNGDQFYVGPGTAYRITWNEGSKKLDTRMNLMYGRLRGVISKEGPRNKLQIKTRAATMGVRGTDFFIADNGPNGETEVSVLRGSVEVKPNAESAKAGKVQEVKTGMSASVTEKLEIRQTTKEDLNGIQKASTLPQQEPASPKIVELEKKAVDVTVKDMQTYQPDLYKQISAEVGNVTFAQQLNTKMIEVVAVKAPSAPPKRRKPRITELKDTDESDFYDKYFKVGN